MCSVIDQVIKKYGICLHIRHTIAFIKDAGYKKMTLDDCDITYDEYISNRFEYLPKNIIALYSGDERRLYRQYYKSNYQYNCSKQFCCPF